MAFLNQGDDLQAAIDAAQPGDALILAARATFTGNFQLPPKPAGPPITITTDAVLPERRVTPADDPILPTIRSGNGDSALRGAPGVANWLIDGVQFGSNTGGHGEVIGLDGSDAVTLDRILIVAGQAWQKRGIQGNGTRITLRRSHVANICRPGQESQAFAAWDGAGPYTVVDNYLEAASINVLFGGANSLSADRIPADILVERNHCSKRLEWRGAGVAVKNLFELKSAKRATIRHNTFEHNWNDAQGGTAIVFTSRNDEGGSPWSVVEDVLFEHNTIRDTMGLFNILGVDSYQPSGRATRITIRHNLCLGSGPFALVGGEVGHLTFDHNTVAQEGNVLTLYAGEVWLAGELAARPAAYAASSLTVTNLLAYHNEFGVKADGGGSGTPALEQMAPGYTWTHNVLAGGYPYPYPEYTWRPPVEEHAAQFTPDYGLAPNSVYCGAALYRTDLGKVDQSTEALPVTVEWQGRTYRGVLTADAVR